MIKTSIFGGSSSFDLTHFLGKEFDLFKAFTKRGVEVSLPKTGNHAELFAIAGIEDSATKDQVSKYISKLMVQFLVEYEDNNGKFQ